MACGIDFGTSNSTVGLVRNGKSQLLVVEGRETTIPTALFFAADGITHYGRAGIAEYIDGEEGRFMRALKSILGSSLVEERTRVGKRTVAFTDIIAMFLRHLREKTAGAEAVVLGRPVYYVDGDAAADQKAENQMAAAARTAGFTHVEFEFEPIAAAFDYEENTAREELVLVADIGGGTTDFSLVRVSPEARGRAERKQDILASHGVHVGGTDFDRVLNLAAVMPHLGYCSKTKEKGHDMPVGYFHDLATWHKIPFLYTGRTLTDMRELRDMAAAPELLNRYLHILEEHLGHQLLFKVEAAKIDLSDAATAVINLDLVEAGLAATATQAMLQAASANLTGKIRHAVGEILVQSGVRPADVATIAFTGGASRMPIVRAEVAGALPHAGIYESAALTSVGAGLALAAGRRFGT